MARNAQPDADDLFADTRMSFGDHIEDLQASHAPHRVRHRHGGEHAIASQCCTIMRPSNRPWKEFKQKRLFELAMI